MWSMFGSLSLRRKVIWAFYNLMSWTQDTSFWSFLGTYIWVCKIIKKENLFFYFSWTHAGYEYATPATLIRSTIYYRRKSLEVFFWKELRPLRWVNYVIRNHSNKQSKCQISVSSCLELCTYFWSVAFFNPNWMPTDLLVSCLHLRSSGWEFG